MCIPIAWARFATSLPILPSPTIPSVFSFSSTPMNRERFHSFCLSEAFACGMLRARESIMAMVCSVAARVFPSGAFATMIPFRVAASISILSTPAPALPMNRRFFPASITREVTSVPLRTSRAS
ncbi:MAG: hypothetical protein A4E37_00184 [Methanoregulaceae archaeon PtaB.Bin056]|nr:MAG: hypothetical protein A4E37_00184 [Methanoregulaceae archaeon PtaB.Bin056]